MNDKQKAEYLSFAEQLAHKAGETMRRYFQAKDIEVVWKDGYSPVTEADTKINKAVIESVKKAYPDHGVIGEEESYQTEAKTVWVVDPIDGTASFDLGMPAFTFCLALVVDGVVQLSVIFEPIQQKLYTATKGGGTFCGEVRKRIPETRHLSQHYIFVPTNSDEPGDRFGPIVKALRRNKTRIVTLSSFNYMSLMLLEGKMAASFMPYGSPWDAAAISLIIEEAGGKATDLKGKHRLYNKWGDGIVLGGKKAHKQILEMIKQCES